MVYYQSLTGKQWKYGQQDCYTIVRDYYKLLGISLPDFPRPDDLKLCKSVFMRHARELGFQRINFNCRRQHDVLIMNLGTASPMHGAIYLKGDRLLHQRMSSLSAVEPLGRYYRSSVVAVYRYATGFAGR